MNEITNDQKCFGNVNYSTLFGPMALSWTHGKFNIAEKQISNYKLPIIEFSIITHQIQASVMTLICIAIQYNTHQPHVAIFTWI